MKSIIRYKTKPEAADENQRLVEEVYRELADKKPAGLQYATFRLADGVSFVHIALIESDTGPTPLAKIAAFAEFQRELAQRCEEQPVAVGATVVGSYRFFAG
jgi:hypothetical protein